MEELLQTLRDRTLAVEIFRQVATKISASLVEKTKELVLARGVETNKIIAVIILRSGTAFLESIVTTFSQAPVGVIGLRRDEITLEPQLYYENLPPIAEDTTVLIFDPMLATGGTARALVLRLLALGAEKQNIYFTGIIAAPLGLERLTELIPRDNLIISVIDKELDDKGMIVPGIGDFGDRYFGFNDKAVIT